MPHFVNDECIMCKYTDCVESCPVDCFFEHDKMLIIDPDICIDCGVCIPECPVDAIYNDESSIDGKSVEELITLKDSAKLTLNQKNALEMLEFNKEQSKICNNLTKIKEPLKTADEFAKVKGKLKYIK